MEQRRGIGRMSRRAAAWLAWSIWALCVALLALTVLLDNYTPPAPDKGISNVYAFVGVPLLVYVTVGAFVGSRRPKNLVGWMLCAIGFVFAAVGFSVAYATTRCSLSPAPRYQAWCTWPASRKALSLCPSWQCLQRYWSCSSLTVVCQIAGSEPYHGWSSAGAQRAFFLRRLRRRFTIAIPCITPCG